MANALATSCAVRRRSRRSSRAFQVLESEVPHHTGRRWPSSSRANDRPRLVAQSTMRSPGAASEWKSRGVCSSLNPSGCDSATDVSGV